MKMILALVFCAAAGLAQPTVSYRVSFENAVHHEAVIAATFANLPPGTLEARMSRSSPGRYALHEFAKNVYNVTASDGRGRPLPITRPNPHEWDVAGHDGTVTITYTLFADQADGTYPGIDRTHAHLMMPATFLYARGLDDRPIRVEFRIPDDSGWDIATQLLPTDRRNVFTAPNLQYLMDSPTELAPITWRTWIDSTGTAPRTFRLALHYAGTPPQADAYAAMARAIVEEEKAVFGELPAYEGGTYTFIADYLPYVAGDGMEHRNSTTLVDASALKTDAQGLLGTLAHEFFHSWNVERIRPKSLEPFNFEEANMSAELWFAEGFTSYYQTLFMARAGMTSIDRFARSLSGQVNALENAPGRSYFSLEDMSRQAPFVDAAAFVDVQNKGNTYLSYYTWGSALGLGLDLTLRSAYPGLTLDDYMRSVWRLHGATEIPYTNADLRRELGAFTGDTLFAARFFRDYMEGNKIVDYRSLLARAGFLVRNAKPGKASAGQLSARYADGIATVTAPTLVGSPWYRAGIDRKDRITAFDGKPLGSEKDLDSALARHKPGDSVPVAFEQRGAARTASVVLVPDAQLEVVPYEQAGLAVTPEIAAFRAAWLASRAAQGARAVERRCGTCKRSYPFAYEFCPYDGEALKLTLE
jgi:predicted metalloprotease with PDZ domain